MHTVTTSLLLPDSILPLLLLPSQGHQSNCLTDQVAMSHLWFLRRRRRRHDQELGNQVVG